MRNHVSERWVMLNAIDRNLEVIALLPYLCETHSATIH